MTDARASDAHASDAHGRSLLRKMFSFPVAMAALLTLLAVLTLRARFNDPDMWWHLKMGEIMWNTHAIPRVDLFSFTTNQHAYTPHEWLPQLAMYAAYHVGGYSALMLWLCVFASLLLISGYALCWLYSGNGKIAFLGAMGIWFFATVGLSARPQLIGYLLLVAELLILWLGRNRNSKWFFTLPLLFAVWVNCHGSFLLGLLVAGAMLFCGLVEFRMGLLVCDRWQTDKRNALAVSLLLSIAALFLNPVGLSQITYPINTMFGQHIGLQSVSEWQPLPMSDSRVWFLFGCAAFILLLPLLRRTELRAEELLLGTLGFVLAVQHARMFFVFGILAMPVLARLLDDAWDRYEPGRDSVLPNLILIAVVAVSIVPGFPNSRNLADQVRKSNPVKAMEFISRAGLSGRMLNEYVYGGYLIWAAPERKVFIDGRADVYEWTGVLGDYMDWANMKEGPSVLLDKYKIDFCLLSREEPIVRVLPLVPGWEAVYSDDMSVVFARTANVSRTGTGVQIR